MALAGLKVAEWRVVRPQALSIFSPARAEYDITLYWLIGGFAPWSCVFKATVIIDSHSTVRTGAMALFADIQVVGSGHQSIFHPSRDPHGQDGSQANKAS
jgi:hypothetical protein